MNEQQALEYLDHRVRDLDNRYRSTFPQWTNVDLVAVHILLRQYYGAGTKLLTEPIPHAIWSQLMAYVRDHRDTWRDKDELYWLAGLSEEVGELAACLTNSHEDPIEHELLQIASICLNWLIRRQER